MIEREGKRQAALKKKVEKSYLSAPECLRNVGWINIEWINEGMAVRAAPQDKVLKWFESKYDSSTD